MGKSAKGDAMTWFLCAYLFTGSGWISGEYVDGWACRKMATEQECKDRQRFGNLVPSPDPRFSAISFECEKR